MPNALLEVSPCLTSTWSTPMPNWSAMIWANVVSWPWPWEWVPVNTVTEPVGLTRTVADS